MVTCLDGHRWHFRTVGKLALGAILMWVLSSKLALAQTQRFTVDILGAGELTPLLQAHLPIVRAAQDPEINEDEWQGLVRRSPQQIQALLSTEGYFSAQVRSEETINQRAYLVRFHVNPGKPVLVTDIALELTGAIEAMSRDESGHLQTLRRQWSLQPGERFTQSAWDKAKTTLLNQLLQRNFPAARIIDSHATIDPPTHSARLRLMIDSGPAFTLGDLDIHGLSRYSPALIRRVSPLRPGEPYRQERLSELQSRLLDTGYFRSVFVTIDADPDKAEGAPVHVELSEHPSKQLSVGMGASTDVGARLQLKWLNRHFLGEDWRLESLVRADRLSQLAQSELYFQPLPEDWLFGKIQGWIPSVALALERTTLTGAETEKIRHSVRLSTPSRTNERVLSVSLLADRRTIPGIAALSREALIAGYAWTRRQFDQALAPSRGYSAGIDLSAGVGGSLHQNRMARVLFSGVWLRPLHSRWTAVVRLQAGQIRGAREDSIPEDLLFRTGGDQTVRGYGYGTLGVPRHNAIVGGNVMALISAEMVARITPAWGAALFYDAGDAALSWHDFRWRRGVGVGARWRSPIGALNIDLARGLDQGETRLHFSVGYGF